MPRPASAPPLAPVAALPDAGIWRRAEIQLATRLGLFPGDRVLLFAPPARDPTAMMAQRLPRLKFVQVNTGPFAWESRSMPGNVERVHGSTTKAPFANECFAALVAVLTVPLLAATEHRAFVRAWSRTLYPFGKWVELLATARGDDPAIGAAEKTLRAAGFEKVKASRLALGRLGGALVLLTARWPGSEDDGEE